MTEKEAIQKIMNGDVIDLKKNIEKNFSTAFVGAGMGYVYASFNKSSKVSGLVIGGLLGYFIGRLLVN